MRMLINGRFFETHTQMKRLSIEETTGFWYSRNKNILHGHSFQLKGHFDDIKSFITKGSTIIYDNGIINSVKICKILSISRLSKLSDGDIVKVSYVYDDQLLSKNDAESYKRMLSIRDILC